MFQFTVPASAACKLCRKDLEADLWASLSLPDIIDHGWVEDGRIKWIQQSFSDDITELLIFDNDINDNSENTFEDYGSDIDSDSKEDESGDQIQKCFPNICCKCISI